MHDTRMIEYNDTFVKHGIYVLIIIWTNNL